MRLASFAALLAAPCLLTAALCAPALAAPKPVVAILEYRGSPPVDDRLARLIRWRVAEMGRFALAPEAWIAQGQDGSIADLARKLGARIVLVPEVEGNRAWRERHEEETVHKHREGDDVEVVKVKTVHTDYTDSVRAAVRIVDESSGFDQRLWFGAVQTSDDSNFQAQNKALDAMVQTLAVRLRELYPLHARIVSRDGRSVTLDAGSHQGLREGYFFHLATSPDAIVHVETVDPRSSTAWIVGGYYRVAVGQGLTEDPAPDLPRFFGVGYVNRVTFAGKALQTTLNGIKFDLNDSGAEGPALGADIGFLDDITGIGALSLGLHVTPQLECIPEILWLDATLGAEADFYELYSQGDALSDQSLHALASVGARVALPLGFKLSASLGYMSPWTVGSWSLSGADGSSTPASGPLPSFTVGGPFVRGSVLWEF